MNTTTGWTPPFVGFDELRVGDATKLQAAFPLCANYFDIMTQVSAETSGKFYVLSISLQLDLVADPPVNRSPRPIVAFDCHSRVGLQKGCPRWWRRSWPDAGGCEQVSQQ